MDEAENGFAVLSGVTVVTVTLVHPPNPLQKPFIDFRQSGVLLPTAENM